MMKVISSVIFAFVTVSLLCGALRGQSPDASSAGHVGNKGLEEAARKEVNALFAEKAFGGMYDLVHKWKVLSEPERKEILIQLLSHLESLETVELTDTSDMDVVSRVANKKMRGHATGTHLWQDVFTVGGRCAFAIEELLDFGNSHLPTITEGMEPDALHKAVQEAHVVVIRRMKLPKASLR